MKVVNWNEFIGKRFNSLTITKIIHIPDKHGDLKPYAECECDCGKTAVIYIYSVVKGAAKTCGCGRKTAPDTDVGSVYGRLTVIERADTINGVKRWKCKCTCGNTGIYTEKSLRRHKRTRCGFCIPMAKPGERYGNLVVLEDLGFVNRGSKNRRIHGIRCKCDCGKESVVDNYNLIKGYTKSCGCQTALNPKDPRSDDPLINELYGRAVMILTRCRNYQYSGFYNYGGRGVKCKLGDTPWDVAEALSKVPGYFKGAQIDRIDNNGHYEMGNIRWVTGGENIHNSIHMNTMTKEDIASRLLTLRSVITQTKRANINLKDVNMFRFSELPSEHKVLYLAVHKDLNSVEYIDKMKNNFKECDFELKHENIVKIDINGLIKNKQSAAKTQETE